MMCSAHDSHRNLYDAVPDRKIQPEKFVFVQALPAAKGRSKMKKGEIFFSKTTKEPKP